MRGLVEAVGMSVGINGLQGDEASTVDCCRGPFQLPLDFNSFAKLGL